MIGSQAQQRDDFERMDLLIETYFPYLNGNMTQMRQYVSEASAIEADFRRLYKQGLFESADHAQRYANTLVSADVATKALTHALAVSLRSIARNHA